MRKCLFVAFCLLAGALLSAEMSKSVPAGWTEDFAAAKKTAATEKKRILMAFSGSDWCPWCVKMEKDVFSQAAFVSQATNDFVLVMIDCPSDRGILSPLAKKQNNELARQYDVTGFPATYVLDQAGTVIQVFRGYQRGGPEAALKRFKKASK